MPTVLLTDRRVAGLKAVNDRIEYFDRALPGFGVRVSPSGAKTWIALYRVATSKLDDKGRPIRELRRSTLGTYPDLSLVKARAKARDEIQDAGGGRDRATERQDAKGQTFAALADVYLEQHAKRRKRSWREDDGRLRRVLVPAWGPRPVASLRRSEIRELLDGIAARGAKTEANRTLALIRKMLNFAVDREWIDANPAAGLARPGGKEASRDRVLSPDELRRTWRHLQQLPPAGATPLDARLWTLSRAALALRLVTAQRGGEVIAMRWADIAGDWWTVPGSITKNGIPHRVPLTAPAKRIVKRLRAEAPAGAEHVFVGIRGPRQRRGALDGLGLDDVRPHDFRRTAATAMGSAGVSRLVIAKVLNHVSADNTVTAIYDRATYDVEKRRALETWASTLGAIVKPRSKKATNVIRMRQA